MSDYQSFLDSKRLTQKPCGFEPVDLNPHLFDFQRDIVKWACRKGRVSPFGGIGSEGYIAVKDGRKYIGIELKKSYFDLACKNLAAAVEESQALTLFDMKQVC